MKAPYTSASSGSVRSLPCFSSSNGADPERAQSGAGVHDDVLLVQSKSSFAGRGEVSRPHAEAPVAKP